MMLKTRNSVVLCICSSNQGERYGYRCDDELCEEAQRCGGYSYSTQRSFKEGSEVSSSWLKSSLATLLMVILDMVRFLFAVVPLLAWASIQSGIVQLERITVPKKKETPRTMRKSRHYSR